jgi:hypothetical protein
MRLGGNAQLVFVLLRSYTLYPLTIHQLTIEVEDSLQARSAVFWRTHLLTSISSFVVPIFSGRRMDEHQESSIFDQKRGYLRAKIKFFKNFLTALTASSYENPESRIEDFFRIKSAGSSNYRGATFFPVLSLSKGLLYNMKYEIWDMRYEIPNNQ